MGRAATDPEAKTIMPESLTEEIVEAAEQAKQAIVRGEDGSVGINFEKILSGPGAKALIYAVSEVTATATHAVKRGTQTWDDTTRGAQQLLADELGVTSTFLRRKSGQLFNDQEMEAGRTILIKSAEELDRMSLEIIDMAAAGTTDAAKLLAFRRQMAIHAGFQMQYQGAQTEIARAMQSFRKPIGSDINPELVMDMLNGNGAEKCFRRWFPNGDITTNCCNKGIPCPYSYREIKCRYHPYNSQGMPLFIHSMFYPFRMHGKSV